MTEGRPHIVDAIINKQIDLIVNTAVGKQAIADSFQIRRSAVDRQVPYVTTMRGAEAVVKAIEALRGRRSASNRFNCTTSKQENSKHEIRNKFKTTKIK